jgi:hypothetical protein
MAGGSAAHGLGSPPISSMGLICFYDFIFRPFLLLWVDYFTWQRHCLRETIWSIYLTLVPVKS